MRNVLLVLVTLAVFACAGPTQTEMNRLPPPTLSITATTQVLSIAGGAPVLQVSAAIRNATTQRIQVSVGANCPLYVHVFPDPTGQYQLSTDPSMACAAGASTLDLVPGDSTVLTRVLAADELASRAPGTYGVGVAVTTSTALIGVWAGIVQLPLANLP